MNKLKTFCSTLQQSDFYRLSKNTRSLLYHVAINCDVDHTLCRKVKYFYERQEKLTLTAGIFDRKDLTSLYRLNPAQKISNHNKGLLKKTQVHNLLHKFNIHPNSVYFFDNCEEIIATVKELDVNTIFMEHPLQPSDLSFSNTPSMILLDFDKTLTTTRFKKKYLYYSTEFLIDRYFGGQERLDFLKISLRNLEKMGVRIGLISFHTKQVLNDVLSRISWI